MFKQLKVNVPRRYNHVRSVPLDTWNPRTHDPTHSFPDEVAKQYDLSGSSHAPDPGERNFPSVGPVVQPYDAPALPVRILLARPGQGSHA